jgi:pre-rRNA-processing protein IPI3
MNEVVIVTSSKDAGGMCVVDLASASSIGTNYKNCIADAGCMCTIGGPASFAGMSSFASDYICAAQAKKPIINFWQWGRVQPQITCHVQDIITSIAGDPTGTYVIAGSKKGWVYIWQVSSGSLLYSFQAHFKEITRLEMSASGDYFVTCAADGMARAWDTLSIVDVTDVDQSHMRRTVIPYRSWSPHTLAVRDMKLLGRGAGCGLRVITCSTDRCLVMYDVHADKQVWKTALSEALESITLNPNEDFVFAGSTGGAIYMLPLSPTASAVGPTQGSTGNKKDPFARIQKGNSEKTTVNKSNVTALEGHTKTVTSLAFSLDNSTLVSVSEDGSLRCWDVWTQQCLREVKPLGKNPLSNAKVSLHGCQVRS